MSMGSLNEIKKEIGKGNIQKAIDKALEIFKNDTK